MKCLNCGKETENIVCSDECEKELRQEIKQSIDEKGGKTK